MDWVNKVDLLVLFYMNLLTPVQTSGIQRFTLILSQTSHVQAFSCHTWLVVTMMDSADGEPSSVTKRSTQAALLQSTCNFSSSVTFETICLHFTGHLSSGLSISSPFHWFSPEVDGSTSHQSDLTLL